MRLVSRIRSFAVSSSISRDVPARPRELGWFEGSGSFLFSGDSDERRRRRNDGGECFSGESSIVDFAGEKPRRDFSGDRTGDRSGDFSGDFSGVCGTGVCRVGDSPAIDLRNLSGSNLGNEGVPARDVAGERLAL